jgi:hypothetical protein
VRLAEEVLVEARQSPRLVVETVVLVVDGALAGLLETLSATRLARVQLLWLDQGVAQGQQFLETATLLGMVLEPV